MYAVGGPEVMHTTAQAIAIAGCEAQAKAFSRAPSPASVGTGRFGSNCAGTLRRGTQQDLPPLTGGHAQLWNAWAYQPSEHRLVRLR